MTHATDGVAAEGTDDYPVVEHVGLIASWGKPLAGWVELSIGRSEPRPPFLGEWVV